MKADILILRVAFVGLLILLGYLLNPFERTQRFGLVNIGDETTRRLLSAGLGAVISFIIIGFEMRVRRASLKTLIGAAVGSILGIVGAFLIGVLISIQKEAAVSAEMQTFLTISLAFFMGYIGLMVGAAKGDYLDLSALGGIFSDKHVKQDFKILDTSVIIDGRIADVAETGFLGGTLIIPHFILAELQQVADSADSSKRQRGRRGLDMLQRLRNNSKLDVQIVETDFPAVKEVDLKLIELGAQLDAVIVTNDFNLNKVSQLRGVEVLNINELANAVKPVVLPGEAMRVFILKEGKEYNQGVAYLDDGTMVVVDNARKLIGKTADIAVTSVLQTTAGKMIFGRLWEERDEAPPQTTPTTQATQTTESSFSVHDSRSLGFRKATRELRQTTIIEEVSE
ncbi:MAG: TRAM domain-containing protein [Pyrinomonadaceae bacterium]|nr:TRAM domain-containing protein [Chloracidobacterium sp.]MBP7415380.1 TRAM domain-containing protein [Pyrinomonadaceae bacterium]